MFVACCGLEFRSSEMRRDVARILSQPLGGRPRASQLERATHSPGVGIEAPSPQAKGEGKQGVEPGEI